MRAVYFKDDIQCLREAGAIPPALADELDGMFDDLYGLAAEGGNPLETFSLQQCGPLIVLEAGDGAGAFLAAGLPGGVGQHQAEWARRVSFGDWEGLNALFLLGNDCCVSLYARNGALDAESERRLGELADEAGAPPT